MNRTACNQLLRAVLILYRTNVLRLADIALPASLGNGLEAWSGLE